MSANQKRSRPEIDGVGNLPYEGSKKKKIIRILLPPHALKAKLLFLKFQNWES